MRGGPTSKVLNAVAYRAREAVLQFRYRYADVKLTSFRYAMFKSKSSDEAMIRSFKILQDHDPESVTMTLSSKPSGIVIPLHPYCTLLSLSDKEGIVSQALKLTRFRYDHCALTWESIMSPELWVW